MKSIVSFSLLTLSLTGFPLSKVNAQDSIHNNLVHTAVYKTSESGALPKYIKAGKGKQALILIPGLGFDASVFTDLMEANKNNYTMYAITIPGYGNTAAPLMPVAGTSYGEQTWNKGVIEGLIKLIDKEKLQSPVIIGHFVQGSQLALRIAIDHPEKVGKVIVMGGAAKFILINGGKPQEFPLKSTIAYVDKNTAPQWFRSISHQNFNDGNYLPEIYSLDSTKGKQLWQQPAAVPLPVMVRYLCEFLASDITMELDKIKCPVLILRPTFSDAVLQAGINNYVKPQFIDAWNMATSRNSLIQIKDIQAASSFVWKDKPKEVYGEVKKFIMDNN